MDEKFKSEIVSVLEETSENHKRYEQRLRSVEANLRAVLSSLERSEDCLDKTHFNLSRMECVLEETCKAARNTVRWAVATIILCGLICLCSILYCVHISNKSVLESKETKTELNEKQITSTGQI